MKRPDPLSDVPTAKRRQFEHAEAMFLVQNSGVQAKKVDRRLTDQLGISDKVAEYDPNAVEQPEAVVCCRLDLDNPLILPDNVRAECDDCGCDIQHRPDAPKLKLILCICCAARRVRELGENQ